MKPDPHIDNTVLAVMGVALHRNATKKELEDYAKLLTIKSSQEIAKKIIANDRNDPDVQSLLKWADGLSRKIPHDR